MEDFNQHLMDSLDIQVKRVKTRKQTEKQKQNFIKAREVRAKNIALRKKAQEEMKKYENEQLNQDPDYRNREKNLKQLLMMLLKEKNITTQVQNEENKVIIPNSDASIGPSSQFPTKRIQRINENENEDESNEERFVDKTQSKSKPVKKRYSNSSFSKYIPIEEEDGGEEEGPSIFR